MTRIFEKTVSNMQEVAARGGRIILITDERGARRGAGSTPARRSIMPPMRPDVRADRLRRPGPASRLSHGRVHGQGRRPAAQPRQIGDGRVRRRSADAAFADACWCALAAHHVGRRSGADDRARTVHERNPTPPPTLHAGAPVRPRRQRAGAPSRNYFLTGLDRRRAARDHALHHLVVHQPGRGWVKPFIPAAYLPETYLAIPDPRLRPGRRLLGADPAGLPHREPRRASLLDFGETSSAACRWCAASRGVKQIFETVFSQSGTAFRKVGLVEFPGQGHVVARLHLDAARGRRSPGRCRGGEHVSRLPALHAQPDDRLLLLSAARARSSSSTITSRRRPSCVMSAGLIQPDARPGSELPHATGRARATRAGGLPRGAALVLDGVAGQTLTPPAAA